MGIKHLRIGVFAFGFAPALRYVLIDFCDTLLIMFVPTGFRGIGKWLLKILAEFYKEDEDEAEGEDEEQPGGSQRGPFTT